MYGEIELKRSESQIEWVIYASIEFISKLFWKEKQFWLKKIIIYKGTASAIFATTKKTKIYKKYIFRDREINYIWGLQNLKEKTTIGKKKYIHIYVYLYLHLYIKG